jgi:ABC-type polysaccharide/polyol phosphate export permease
MVLRTHIASGASANLAETTKARPAAAAIEPQGLAQQTPFPRNYAEAWTLACAFTAATLLLFAVLGCVVFSALTMTTAHMWQLAMWVMIALFSTPLAVCTSVMVVFVLADETGEARGD